jgi:hypothetical protein
MRIPTILLIAFAFLLLAECLPAAAIRAAMGPPPPRLFLWAWESPQDLKFIDVNKFGVAGLVQTIRLSGSKTQIYRRQQPLRLAPGTRFVAVTRIEIAQRAQPELNDDQLKSCKDRIISSCTGGNDIQIDFDARVSERLFYLKLLKQLRQEMPAGSFVSITALSSWAMGDAWLQEATTEGLVTKVVPMFFQMGPDRQVILRRLKENAKLALGCRDAVGVSVDEPYSAKVAIAWAKKNEPDAEIYFFSPRTWTPNAVAKLDELIYHASPTQIQPAQ